MDEDRRGSHSDTPHEASDEPRPDPSQEPYTGLPRQETFWQTSEGGAAIERAWGMLNDLVQAAPRVRVKIKLSYENDPPITMSYGDPDEEDFDDGSLEDAFTEEGGTLEDLEANPT